MREVWHKAVVVREWDEPIPDVGSVRLVEWAPLCGESNVPWVTRMHREDAAVNCTKCRAMTKEKR
jgi:hypothetical protein